MTDIFASNKRSDIMKKIGPKHSKQELFIRKLIFSLGYRYRLHRKELPGNPDIVFPKHKKVIFINGCFWHHHNCNRGKLPETNKEFWQKKILGNVERDKLNYKKIQNLGWNILIIWQCEIKKKNTELLENKITSFLKS